MLDRQQYDRFRVAPTDPAKLRNHDVERILKKLADSSAGRLKVEKFDESNEGRPIFLATLGTGPRRILLWSQMHGDEPTHTGVMLDLFSYLLQKPEEPLAAEILANCTLMFIPMLNPDGAEAVIRYNAQGIDINRDWRRLASPEGRALLRAAKTLKPQFGFNLHNQNARTSVGRPPRPAAISVLAPAPDLTRKETPSWRAAKQMCACFIEAVQPHALGMISRYDDTHEPRAFGDGIQSLGVSTMLVEAGGWHEDDPEPIVRLHFHGMLHTLHAIATDKYKSTDYQVYDDLPKSNSARLSDCFITKANVLDAKASAPFVADMVIDQTDSERLAVTSSRDGKIVEIGDLPGINARRTIAAGNDLVIPGQFALVRNWKPGTPFDNRQIEELLGRGTTTVVGVVDLGNRDALDIITKPVELPFNWAFVGSVDSLKSDAAIEPIAIAAANGLIGIISKGTDEELWNVIHQLGLPLVKADQLAEKSAGSYQDAAKQALSVATALKLQSRRGRITRDAFADLAFFSDVSQQGVGEAIDWKKLARVMVAGETVWENGKRVGGMPGVFLRRT